MRHCPYCERKVEGKKAFHGIAFILLIFLVWIPGAWIGFAGSAISLVVTNDPTFMGLWFVWMCIPLIYVLYHVFIRKSRCPICNAELSSGVSHIKPQEVSAIKITEDKKYLSLKEKSRSKYNISVLATQIIFGGLSVIFFLITIISILSGKRSINFDFIFIGLILSGITILLNILHKKEEIDIQRRYHTFCEECGVSLVFESIFCSNCGTKVELT